MPNPVFHMRLSMIDGTTFEDTASMSFTVQSATAAPPAIADLSSWLGHFFNDAPTGGSGPICEYISPAITRAVGGNSLEIFDVTAQLGGLPVGSPVAIVPFSLGPTAAAEALPAQLAIVCSYRAAYGTDLERGVSEVVPSTESAIDQGAPATHPGVSKPRARDRGRFYFGPLNNDSITVSAVNPGAVPATVATDLLAALVQYLGPQLAGTGPAFTPVVWSRVGAVVKPIAFAALDAGLGVIRKRADTMINRVLSWTPVA